LFIIPSGTEPNARKILLPKAILDVEWYEKQKKQKKRK